MEYECDRCGYSSNSKSNLLSHLRRKHPCPPTKADVDNNLQIEHLLPKKEYNEKHYKCPHCETCFNTRQNRWRHLKTCKGKTESDAIQTLTSKMEALEKELQEVKNKTILNTVNNQSIENQTNYSIHINSYGQETLDHLPNDFLTSCFMFKNMLSLLENIHFDPDCPQNKNIKLQSLKHKLIKVYQDDKWIAKPAEHVLDELVNKGQTILRRHYKNNREEVEEEMSKEEIDEVVEWLSQIFENNEKIRKPLKHELVALLDNFR